MRLISRLFSTQHTAIAATRKRPLLGGAALLITFVVAALAALVLNPFGSHAQNANVTISFDMVPAGNDYCGGDSFRSDGVTPCSPANSMTVGSVEFCSSSLLLIPIPIRMRPSS